MQIGKIIYFVFIAIIILIFTNGAEAAFNPPAGCTANAYLTRDNGLGTITIDFYYNENYACSQALSKNYLGDTVQRAPFTIIPSDQSDLQQTTLQYIMYIGVAMLSLMALFVGISITNS